MAQRISRAKRSLVGESFDSPGEIGTVLRVLYVIFTEGHTGEVDLAREAIRLTRQLAAVTDDPEVDGLLALMLLTDARRSARWTSTGQLVSLNEQDRSRWDTDLIAEGVGILQTALARDRLGEYQAQAAIAALHDDAVTAEQTDWPQILEWYDDLAQLTDSPVVALNRVVAVGEVDGPLAGLKQLGELDSSLPRYDAVAAYLHERSGNVADAARLYARAAAAAHTIAERQHLTKQAARLNSSKSSTLKPG
jgi:predicted RNA polymerase sigma factor